MVVVVKMVTEVDVVMVVVVVKMVTEVDVVLLSYRLLAEWRKLLPILPKFFLTKQAFLEDRVSTKADTEVEEGWGQGCSKQLNRSGLKPVNDTTFETSFLL